MNYEFHPEAERELFEATFRAVAHNSREPGYWRSRVHDR